MIPYSGWMISRFSCVLAAWSSVAFRKVPERSRLSSLSPETCYSIRKVISNCE